MKIIDSGKDRILKKNVTRDRILKKFGGVAINLPLFSGTEFSISDERDTAIMALCSEWIFCNKRIFQTNLIMHITLGKMKLV